MKKIYTLFIGLAICSFFIFISSNILAQSTGAKYPTLGTTATEAPWSDNDWVTPTNIYSDDAATASVTDASFDNGDQTYVVKATGFDFSAIPVGSTITGVIVKINAWYANGSGEIGLCQLLDASRTKVGTNNCATPVALTTTNTTVITIGGSSDLWGNALTRAWVQDPDFGVAIAMQAAGNNADVYIDYVTVEVFYSAPCTPPHQLRPHPSHLQQ